VSDDRIPLDGDRAMAFTDAFEKRRDYISAELIHHYNDGEDRVPCQAAPSARRQQSKRRGRSTTRTSTSTLTRAGTASGCFGRWSGRR
jgi:hypothetical protein